MRYASDYLDKNKRVITPIIKDVKNIPEEDVDDVIIQRPTCRSECPVQRPCPFVGCKYNLFLDITNDGNLKLNFGDIHPYEMTSSCALDVVEDYPEGLKFSEIARYVGLSREKVRQIEKEALKKIKDSVGEKELRSWLADLYKSRNGNDIYIEETE